MARGERRLWLAAWVALVLAAVAGACPATAQAIGVPSGLSLAVAPISISFDPGVNTAVLTVSNPGETAATVQVRLFAWTAEDGQDAYVPTRDIAFSPVIFQLKPGSKQVVRLLSTSAPSSNERAYRLFVDQLPLADTRGGLQMPVRMILPVFVEPTDARLINRPGALTWTAKYDPATREVTLTVTNSGNRHQKIIDLAYTSDGASHSIRRGLSGYALAGQAHSWTFPLVGPARVLHVKARNESSPIEADVPLAP